MSRKVSSTIRQEVPEGERPEDLPRPASLPAVGMRRRPMPIASPTKKLRGALRERFRRLQKTVDGALKSSGVLAEIERDAADYLRKDAKGAIGRGGHPLDPQNAARLTRLFSRGPMEILSQLLEDQTTGWTIETARLVDDQYAEMYNLGGRAAQRKLGVRPNFRLQNPGILKALEDRANFLTGGIADDTFDRLRTVVAEEFYLKGEGVPSVARSLRDEFDWLGKVRSELVAHTETLAVTSEAQYTAYHASGVEFKRWLTTLDGRERASHFKAHGQLVKIDEPFILEGEQGEVKLMYPGDSFGHPADLVIGEIANCRCLLEGEQVDGPIIALVRARYEGPACEITSGNGRVTRVTADHPVLTMTGFRLAKDLRIGDEVVGCNSVIDRFAMWNTNEKHGPARVEDLFQSLGTRVVRKRATAGQLHGDEQFVESDIDLVASEACLRRESNPAFLKLFYQLLFVNGMKSSALEPGRSHPSGSVRARLPLDRFGVAAIANANAVFDHLPMQAATLNPRAISDALERLTGFVCRDQLLEVRDVHGAVWPVRTSESHDLSMQRRHADAELGRELCQRFPGEMAPCQVRQIRHFDFSGHVYLPQTRTGYYLGSLVSMNCDHIPVILPDQQFDVGVIWDGNLAPDAFLTDVVRRAA